MKLAINNGYAEPLAWLGSSNNLPGLCWLPKIDENGSSNVEGNLKISCVPESVSFTENGIEIIGTEYIINSEVENMWSTDGNHIVDGGLTHGKIKVRVGNNHETITVSGTRRMLGEIKPGNVLLVPNKVQWKAEDFAILASKEGKSYHRIDIANLEEGADKLKEENEKKILIGIKKELADFQQQ